MGSVGLGSILKIGLILYDVTYLFGSIVSGVLGLWVPSNLVAS